jgi:hypothetical protein
MIRHFLAAALAVSVVGPSAATAASYESLTAAQFSTCKAAADQPICLLKLAAQSKLHQPYRENLAIAYAPAVLAAIGQTPPTTSPIR